MTNYENMKFNKGRILIMIQKQFNTVSDNTDSNTNTTRYTL